MTDVFITEANQNAINASSPFQVQSADPHVFVAAKAHAAHPKTKAEAAALRDMDDPAVIRPEVEAAARARRNATSTSPTQ